MFAQRASTPRQARGPGRAPEYRLRVGQFRVLFEVEDGIRIVVYRIVHRREAYR